MATTPSSFGQNAFAAPARRPGDGAVRTALSASVACSAHGPAETCRQIADTLDLLQQRLAPARRVVHAGDAIYRAGDRFVHLYVLNSGLCKVSNLAPDGREQLVCLNFRGDWLGLDGMAGGHYSSDAVAMDTGEIWVLPYAALLASSQTCPALLQALHAAMGRALVRDRDALMSVCTLPAVARVADFLLHWAGALAERGLRTDQITLRMTRAEIGNHLGMTLESVSRALGCLARHRVIGFPGTGRREVHIPDVEVLSAFVQRHLSPGSLALN